MKVGDKIKQLREEKGLMQQDVCNVLGIEQSTLANYENNRRVPKLDILISIAGYFHVSLDWLMGISPHRSATPPKRKGRGVPIPVLGKVVAGIPIEAVQEILDYEEITPELAATGDFFALKIRGRSMEPRMREGDVVIVKRQDDIDSGDVAIILVNGNEATVKRVKKQREGITLIATNTAVYEPHFYSNKEIQELPVQILGKVVEFRGKM